MKLIIGQTRNDEDEPNIEVSYKLREYICELVIKEVLIPSGAYVKHKWGYDIYVVSVPGDKSPVELFAHTIHRDEKIKSYPLSLPFEKIINSKNINRKYVEFLIEGLILFFKTLKINDRFYSDFKSKIDFEVVESIKYPAIFKEQLMTGDEGEERYSLEKLGIDYEKTMKIKKIVFKEN